MTDVFLLGLATVHGGRFVTLDQAVSLPAVRDATEKNLMVQLNGRDQSSANSTRCSSLNAGIAASESAIFARRYPRTFPDIATIASRDFPRP